MSKSKEPNINQMLLKAHRQGVKQAIDTAARTKTSLIVFENGKIKSIKPKYKYVRVSLVSSEKQPASNRLTTKKKK